MKKEEITYYKRVVKNGKEVNIKITKKEYEKFIPRERKSNENR
jgi:hypothetical protein